MFIWLLLGAEPIRGVFLRLPRLDSLDLRLLGQNKADPGLTKLKTSLYILVVCCYVCCCLLSFKLHAALVCSKYVLELAFSYKINNLDDIFSSGLGLSCIDWQIFMIFIRPNIFGQNLQNSLK